MVAKPPGIPNIGRLLVGRNKTMPHLFNSRVGLPLAAIVPISLPGCEADGRYRPYDAGSPSYYYYDNYFTRGDSRGGGSWGSESVEDHVREKYRRRQVRRTPGCTV